DDAGWYGVGCAGGLVCAPAVPPRQLDRLPAPSLSPGPGPEGRGYRPVRQAEELEVGPPDPAGQGHPLLQVPVGLLWPRGVDLGDAEVDHGPRPQLPAQPEPRGVRGLGGGEQPLRLLGDGQEVAALPGEPEPHDGEEDLHASAPLRGYRYRTLAAFEPPRCPREVTLG